MNWVSKLSGPTHPIDNGKVQNQMILEQFPLQRVKNSYI